MKDRNAENHHFLVTLPKRHDSSDACKPTAPRNNINPDQPTDEIQLIPMSHRSALDRCRHDGGRIVEVWLGLMSQRGITFDVCRKMHAMGLVRMSKKKGQYMLGNGLLACDRTYQGDQPVVGE